MTEVIFSYNPFRIKNSPVEFVAIGLVDREFRPIAISDNCSLDLLGYAASHSYTKGSLRRKFRPFSVLSPLRKSSESYVTQSVEFNIASHKNIEADDFPDNKIIFFWKGAPIDKESAWNVERLGEINFSIIMGEIYQLKRKRANFLGKDLEVDQQKKSLSGFLEWHISPIVKAIADYNLSYDYSKDLMRIIFSIYALIMVFSVAGVTFIFFERFLNNFGLLP